MSVLSQSLSLSAAIVALIIMGAAVMSLAIFPFFTTKPVGKGPGLGLSMSYQIIVEQHKGRLCCQSELGKGTEFTIELPVSAAVSQ